MQTSTSHQHPGALSAPGPAASVEDALMGTLIALGRRMRSRQPEDTLDFAVVPILKALSIGGALRLSAIADALQLDASTVSRHVKQLEEHGYLQRATDPDDGRASRIQLSPEGQTALAGHMDRRKSLINKAIEHWSADDREVLRTLLDRFNRDVNKEVTKA
jgi:DNA-binding MarR family transcriptional regulator